MNIQRYFKTTFGQFRFTLIAFEIMILIKTISAFTFFASTNFLTRHFFFGYACFGCESASDRQIAHLKLKLAALLTQNGILMATLLFFSPYVSVICRCIYYSVFAIRHVSLSIPAHILPEAYKLKYEWIQTFCIFSCLLFLSWFYWTRKHSIMPATQGKCRPEISHSEWTEWIRVEVFRLTHLHKPSGIIVNRM